MCCIATAAAYRKALIEEGYSEFTDAAPAPGVPRATYPGAPAGYQAQQPVYSKVALGRENGGKGGWSVEKWAPENLFFV